MKFKTSYDLLLFYFQDIMDLNHEELDWKPNEREVIITKICNDYKNSFGALFEYPESHIWKIILKKYNKQFDNLLYDRTNEDSIRHTK